MCIVQHIFLSSLCCSRFQIEVYVHLSKISSKPILSPDCADKIFSCRSMLIPAKCNRKREIKVLSVSPNPYTSQKRATYLPMLSCIKACGLLDICSSLFILKIVLCLALVIFVYIITKHYSILKYNTNKKYQNR